MVMIVFHQECTPSSILSSGFRRDEGGVRCGRSGGTKVAQYVSLGGGCTQLTAAKPNNRNQLEGRGGINKERKIILFLCCDVFG